MIYSIFGFGKGKTESSIGIAIRAYQNNEKILFSQFLKDGSSSEIDFFNTYCYDRITTESMGTHRFNKPNKKETMDFVNHILFLNRRDKYNLIILDEVLVALDLEYLSMEEFELMLYKLEGRDIYLTGRISNHTYRKKIIELSDISTNAFCERHIFDTYCNRCGNSHPYYYDYCPKCGEELVVSRQAIKGRDY